MRNMLVCLLFSALVILPATAPAQTDGEPPAVDADKQTQAKALFKAARIAYNASRVAHSASSEGGGK